MSRRLAGVACGVFALSLWCAATATASPIYWVDWQRRVIDSAGFTAFGTITTSNSTVNVTYNNPIGVGFFQDGTGGTDYWANYGGGRNDAISPYTSSVVDNSPTGTDIIALQYAGGQTLTFSQAIGNPVFAYVSLNGNGYEFVNQDFTILSQGGVDGNACGYWGCGQAGRFVVQSGSDTLYELNSTNVGGREPHGTIQFAGAFNTLTWYSESNEYWNGFTVGVQGTAQEVFPGGEVPEPTTLVLFGTGLVAVGRRLIKRRRGGAQA